MDKLLRLARESESTQAIDRLRSVRSSHDEPKTIWILCNIPLDITVSNLLEWDRYQVLVEMVNKEDCFVVYKEYPYFKTMEQSVRSRNLQKWEKMHYVNRSSISEMHKLQFSVNTDSNSTFTAYIAATYKGSKEQLIASKLGITTADITLIEKDGKPN